MSLKVSDFQYRTGNTCPVPGYYSFERYAVSTDDSSPRQPEKEIAVDKGDTFPKIESTDNPCFWVLERTK